MSNTQTQLLPDPIFVSKLPIIDKLKNPKPKYSTDVIETVKQHLIEEHVQSKILVDKVGLTTMTDEQYETFINSFPFERKYLKKWDVRRLEFELYNQ